MSESDPVSEAEPSGGCVATPPSAPSPSGPSAATIGEDERPRWFGGKAYFWIPIAPLVALDLWSKAAVFGFLAERYGSLTEGRRQHEVWVNGAVDFHLVAWRNTGTIWGLGKDFTAALIVLRCFALLLLVWFASRTRQAQRLQQFVLGLIMAGAIGNLYDNLYMPIRGVRDFLSFTLHLPFLEGPYGFPAFNVADSCICVGAITLAILLWRSDDSPARD